MGRLVYYCWQSLTAASPGKSVAFGSQMGLKPPRHGFIRHLSPHGATPAEPHLHFLSYSPSPTILKSNSNLSLTQPCAPRIYFAYAQVEGSVSFGRSVLLLRR